MRPEPSFPECGRGFPNQTHQSAHLCDHERIMFQIPHTRQTVYLSASWAAQNRPLNLSIASLLANEGLIVIGEHPTRPSDQGGKDYPERVDEYLKNCAGIVCVFPVRPDRKQSTSSAMFIEVLVASKYGLLAS